MSLTAITYFSASLICQQKYFQAIELLGCALYSHYETKTFSSFDSLRSDMSKELMVVPVTYESNISWPAQDSDFFRCPFMIVGSKGDSFSIDAPVAGQMARSFEAICLFNLGLCYHLASSREGVISAMLLRKACVFYEHAWATLQHFMDAILLSDSGMKYILMAICANLSKCYYHLGQLDASKEAMESLDEILRCCLIEEDEPTLQLHDFFVLVAAVNTGFIAAGAA